MACSEGIDNFIVHNAAVALEYFIGAAAELYGRGRGHLTKRGATNLMDFDTHHIESK